MIQINTLAGMEDVMDYYWIHENGDVESTGRRPMVLKTRIIRGYITLSLKRSEASGYRTCGQHRLKALAFIPNPENKPHVNHIDENKENNDLPNLEWTTVLENNIHGTKQERYIKTRTGTKNTKILPIETWETRPIRRSEFKKILTNRGLEFNDFCESLSGWKDKSDGKKYRVYTYLSKKGC